MSKREAVLCDLHPWDDIDKALCGRLSIGMCVACNRDVCDKHTRHPNGALRIKLTIMQGSDPQGPERVANELVDHAVFCTSCETALMRLGTRDLIQRIGVAAHEIIRAALAAAALK